MTNLTRDTLVKVICATKDVQGNLVNRKFSVNYQILKEQWKLKEKGFWFQSALSTSRPIFLHYSLACHAHIKFVLSPSLPEQVGDAGRVLREWHSRGKTYICTMITVMTPPIIRWHLDIAWPHITRRPPLSVRLLFRCVSLSLTLSLTLSFSPLFLSISLLFWHLTHIGVQPTLFHGKLLYTLACNFLSRWIMAFYGKCHSSLGRCQVK